MIYLTIFAVCMVMVGIGHLLRRRQEAKYSKTLEAHRRYMAKFEEENPQYRGTQWGKP